MNNQLACHLFEYIRRRAKAEGVEFDLSLEIFQFAAAETVKAFGVSHDGQQMLSDDQEPYPGFFEANKKELLANS